MKCFRPLDITGTESFKRERGKRQNEQKSRYLLLIIKKSQNLSTHKIFFFGANLQINGKKFAFLINQKKKHLYIE